MSVKNYLYIVMATLVLLAGCKKKQEEAQSARGYLFVSSGLCYSGNGITTFTAATASNMVYKVITETGQRDSVIADYNSYPASSGDTPISIVDWDSNNLMVMVRNGTTISRLETLPKLGGSRTTFGTNPAIGTILSTAPQNMTKAPDGGLLMIRTGFIEKVNSTGVRPSTPWVNNNLGATCGTANVLYTNVVTSNSGRIVTANAAASPNNRVISVPAAGASASCSAGLAAPATTTFATALAMDKINNKLFVAYAGPTVATDVNSIYVYDFDDSTGAISNGQKVYDAASYPGTYSYLLFGISAMTYDSDNKLLYVATAISTATTVVNYAIERFSYDVSKLGSSNSTVLTRSGTTPFYNYGVDTKCISQMFVANVVPE